MSGRKWAILVVALVVAIGFGVIAYTHPSRSSGSVSGSGGIVAVMVAVWAASSARRVTKCGQEDDR